MTTSNTLQFSQVAKFLLLTIIFGIAYTQEPLYSSSQNTYFIHGLAQGGLGYLSEDWLAQAVDPVPVFSFLVYITYRFLDESVFYGYHLAILGLYLYSILGIASLLYKIDNSKLQFFIYFVLIATVHSALANPPVSFGYNHLSWFLQAGVAQQHLLGRVFQPSMCGVFILFSIYLFLRGKEMGAILSSSLAATLHPTYVLSAGILTLAYMLAIFMQGRGIKSALRLGFWALLLIVPIISYVVLHFGATSPDLLKEGQSILVDYRISYQATPKEWFGNMAILQLLIVLAGLYVIRKTPLFIILATFLGAATILTLLQVVTGSQTLALLFPWRLSVFLVPLSTAMLLAYVVSVLFQKFQSVILTHEKFIKYSVFLAAFVILPVFGMVTMAMAISDYHHSNWMPVMKFVATTKQPHQVYLIPTRKSQKWGETQYFRLYTGASIFVDTKSHPYKDVEVVEWFHRVNLASQFYRAKGEEACKLLQEIVANYQITHVILEARQVQEGWGCKTLGQKLFEDANFTVYEVVLD